MSIWHLIILLVVVVVVFGTGKLRHIGSDLGNAMRDFKKGLSGDDEEAKRKAEAEQLRADTVSDRPADKTTQSQHDSSDPK